MTTVSALVQAHSDEVDPLTIGAAQWQRTTKAFVAVAAAGIFVLSLGGRPSTGPAILAVAFICGLLGRQVARVRSSVWIAVVLIVVVSLAFAELRSERVGGVPLVAGVLVFAGVLAQVSVALSLSAFRVASVSIVLLHGAGALLYKDPSVVGVVGLANHKNLFGFANAFAIAVLFPWLLKTADRRMRSMVLAALVCAYISVVVSESSGALLVGIAVGMWSIAVAHRGRLVPLVAAAATAFFGLYVVGVAAGLSLLGEDPTLTGRSTIWRMILERFDEYLVVGDGIGSQWSGAFSGEMSPPLPLTAEVWRVTGERISSSHNGYLELIVSLGLPISLLIVFGMVHAWTRVHAAPLPVTRILSPLFAFVAVSMTVESFLTVPIMMLVVGYLLLNQQRWSGFAGPDHAR